MDPTTTNAIIALVSTLVGVGGVKIWNAMGVNRRKDFSLVIDEMQTVLIGVREDVKLSREETCKAREETAVVRAQHEGCRDEQIQMQRDFGALQGQMTRLQDQNQVAFIQASTDGRIISWNGGATAIFGYSTLEATSGMNVSMLIPERLRKQHHDALERRVVDIRSGIRVPDKVVETRDSRAVRKDGTEFTATIHLSSCKAGEEILLSAEIRRT